MESSHIAHLNAEHEGTQSTTSAAQYIQETIKREIDSYIERLLTIASHELRTPLTTIIGNIQLALRRLSSGAPGAPGAPGASESAYTVEAALELLGRATRQLDRLNNLIEQMLHAERIHEGKLDLQLDRCDLVDIIRDTAEQHRLLWPHRTITLALPNTERGSASLQVAADSDHIARVIAEYLSNALKYSQDDAPVVLLVEQCDDQARVAVRDQGPGLPRDEHERVWERFYRVPGIQELSGSGIGFGLGLYISREIAEKHGGQVGVESAQGKGSTFWCMLPLLNADIQTPGDA